MFDPTDMKQASFAGYGPSDLPSPRDDQVAHFVNNLVAGGPSAVAGALSTVTDGGRQVLRAYAERTASLAVRRGDAAALLTAVVALVIGGLDENRLESLMVMAPIEDSAGRLGIEFPQLLEEASKIVGHPSSVNLMLWLTRKEANRSLSSMGFVATQDAGGFRYKLDW